MQQGTQAIDVGTGRRLRFAVLLWCSVAGRAERNSIPRFAWLKVARDAKIDQVKLSGGGEHNVARLEITEDDWWLVAMQVFKHIAKLAGDVQYFIQRE